MPYKDRQKQLESQRKAMAKRRGVNPSASKVHTYPVNPVNPVNPSIPAVTPSQKAEIATLQTLIKTIEQKTSLPEDVRRLPIYDWSQHKVGDRVRRWLNSQWVAMTVPTLDADGNPFEDYTPGRLVAQPNYARPVSRPDPKPIKRKPVRPFRR